LVVLSNGEKSLLDGKGVKSRKFLLTILSLAILIGMTILCAKVAAMAALYPTFVGGLLGILGLYFGGNVAHRYATGKAVGYMEANPEPDQYMLGYQQPVYATPMNAHGTPGLPTVEVSDEPEGEAP
jgi:hypothetical protein